MNKSKSLEKLKNECEKCFACELSQTRTNIVFADGNPKTASIILIGEAPGENEDLQAKPFVGRAGKLLNNFLEAAGISRENDLYIANIIKCRPPKNRVPNKIEKSTCKHYLLNQISIMNPNLILLCGSTAVDEFLSGKKITSTHGQIFDIEILGKNYKSMPILHPSPLCRFPDKKNVMISDLLLAKDFIS